MAFSPTDAAFEGFRLTREQPRAVLAWAAVYFVFSLVATLFAVAAVGPQLAVFRALNESANPNAAAVSQALAQMTPMLALVAPIEVIFLAVFNCAVYRAVLRPEEGGFAFFRLGRDELRMVALSVILFFLWMGVVAVVGLVVGMNAATLGAVGSPVAAFIGAMVNGFTLCAAIWALVRMSLAAPMTFGEHRITVAGAWRLTKGAFWPLFGAYVLAFLLAAVIFMLTSVISTAAVMVVIRLGGGSISDFGHLVQSDVSSVAAFSRVFVSPPTLLWQACWSVMMTICYVIVISPSAIAYRGLIGMAGPTEGVVRPAG